MIIFQANYDSNIKLIKKQLKEKNRNDIQVVDSKYVGHIDEYDVSPNKEFGIILDMGQNLSLHGRHDDPYEPPVRSITNDSNANAEAMAKATSHLSMEHLALTLNEASLQEVHREEYETKIQEIKSNKTNFHK